MSRQILSVLAAGVVLVLLASCNSLSVHPDFAGRTTDSLSELNQNKKIPEAAPEDWTVKEPGVGEATDAKERRWKPVYFAYDQSAIGETERHKLDKICEYLLSHRGFDLLVEGHCDERGSEEYNRALGERRAISVRDYLVGLGLSKSRVHTLSYGEERPAEKGMSENAFRLNRRAELVIITAKTASAAN